MVVCRQDHCIVSEVAALGTKSGWGLYRKDLYAICWHTSSFWLLDTFLLSSCDTEKKQEKPSCLLCVPTATSGRKGRTHKCTSHCAMGRDVSTLVVLEGCSGICTMDIFAQEGQAQLLSSFWTEKLRTSHVQS